MEEVLKDYGWCKIFQRQGKYYISHDIGGVAIQMREDSVSEEDAIRSATDEKYAQKITIDLIRKSRL